MRIMRIRRREPGQERTSLKHSTRAQGHRVTLTAAPRELSLQQRRALRLSPPRPRDMTGNVQLYLPADGGAVLRMRGPLVRFGAAVNIGLIDVGAVARWMLSRRRAEVGLVTPKFEQIGRLNGMSQNAYRRRDQLPVSRSGAGRSRVCP